MCSQNFKATLMFAAVKSYKSPTHFSDSNRLGLWQSVSYVSGAWHAGLHKICAQYWDIWQNWSAELVYCVKSLSRTTIPKLMIMHDITIQTVL